MKKPLILITGGPAFDPTFSKESRMLNKTYPSAIYAAGGIPVMDLDNTAQEDYIALADGFIFTGTHSFTPDPSLDLAPLQVERIKREHKFMRAVAESGKPMLGICQGMQQLNVAFGGTIKSYFKTESKVEHYYTWHSIKTERGSLANELFGDEFTVNSIHNVRVVTLAKGFFTTALSPDGVIESYQHETLPIYAFQWHPERMRGDNPDFPYGPDTNLLFEYFVKLCENK